MNKKDTLAGAGILLVITVWLQGCAMAPLMHRGGIMVDRWAEVKADDKIVAGILAAFNEAEKALQSQDLDALMNLYAQDYRYHGLIKDDFRKTWAQLFADYQGLRSNHILTRIVADPGHPAVAEVTCTGSLWAKEKDTGDRVNIDSWYGEVHYFVYENGA